MTSMKNYHRFGKEARLLEILLFCGKQQKRALIALLPTLPYNLVFESTTVPAMHCFAVP